MRSRYYLRWTDLPYPKWWAFWFRLFKTVEVLLFKVLELLDLYRTQRSMIAVPGLCTENFTILQAVVYNGMQEEVLGFKPRGLIHRILRGLPELEAFERVQFELTVGARELKVEASTEHRGFIYLQLPWSRPWKAQNQSWVRLVPKGVETLFGAIKLGDYEIVSAPVFYLHDRIKTVIVSDIDDTIKDSRIAESTSIRNIVSGLFRGNYYRYEPIVGMAEFYQELQSRGCLIIYVTSTPFALAPFLLKFLKTANFPDGPVFLRWLGHGRVRHKWKTLHRILSNLNGQRCVMIGDSGEQDLPIYRRLSEHSSYGKKIESVMIRHIPGTLIPKTMNQEHVYREIGELREKLRWIIEDKHA